MVQAGSVSQNPNATEYSMLQEARAEVALADHKASMVMTALGIAFAAILGGLLAGDWKPSNYDASGECLWWMAAAVAVGAVTSAASAVWPRYTAVDVSTGIFYWGHVATFQTLEDLCDALDDQPNREGDRTRHQLHKLSKIVHRKYNLVRAAMVLASASGVLFFVASLTG